MNQPLPLGSPGQDFLTFVDFASRRTNTRLGNEVPGLAAPISLLIRRLNRRLAADSERLLPSELSMADFRVCFTLWAVGPLEPHRVAEASLMSRAAVSAARKSLEGQGLLTVQTSPVDQRSIVLSLTSKGVAVTEDIHRQNLALTQGYLSALTPSEQHVLLGLLGKLAESAADTGQASDPT